MRLIACYSIYNEEKFLKQSLDTVNGKVDAIVIVDGAYEGYDWDKSKRKWHSASWDKTLQIIKDYPFKSELVFIPAPEEPWKTQMLKRSQYFIGKDAHDWYLNIDADETVVHGLDKRLYHTLHIAPPFVNGFWTKRITLGDSRGEYWEITMRLLRHQDGLHYEYHHSFVATKDHKKVVNIGDYPHLLLQHHGHLRPERRAMTARHRIRGRGERFP